MFYILTAAIHPFLYYVFFIKPPCLWCVCTHACVCICVHVCCIYMCAVCAVCAMCEFKYVMLCTWKPVDNLGANLSLPSCFWGIVSSFLISTECTSRTHLCASRNSPGSGAHLSTGMLGWPILTLRHRLFNVGSGDLNLKSSHSRGRCFFCPSPKLPFTYSIWFVSFLFINLVYF